MFHNISLKVGNWDCCTRFFGHHLFFQINFVFLPSFILPSSSFPHIFCPQIFPLPLPSGLPSFSGQNRGQGQGQNLRAKYMGKWRRGQNKRAKIQPLSEKIDVDHKKSGTTIALSYFQWNVMEQTERAKLYLKNWKSLNIYLVLWTYGSYFHFSGF